MSFQPRQIVNGSLLREFIGKNISVVVKVIEEPSGVSLKAQTSDDREIWVTLADPLKVSPDDWIEVIGSATSPDSVQSREVIQFEKGEQEFDYQSHDMLVQFLNKCKNIYKRQ